MNIKKKSIINEHQTGKLEARLMWEGLLIGLISGSIAIAYRLALSYLDDLRIQFYQIESIWMNLLMIPFLILLGIFVAKLLKWAPYSGGSGIPQIHAELLDRIQVDPVPTIISKFVGGSINNFIGLSLGREGPSIQLGGTIAKFIGKLLKRDLLEVHYIMAAGAAAGLAAAFNAPLAGVLFVLEELYGTFSKYLMIPVLIASITANFISFRTLGMEPAFSFRVSLNMPVEEIHWVILIGIIAGIIGCSFNLFLIITQRLYDRIPLPKEIVFSILFILIFIFGRYFTEVLGGGHHLIEEIVAQDFSLTLLLGILFVKLIFTGISFSSGAQGGIFLPVLVLGATTGAIVFQAIDAVFIIENYETNFIIIGMAAILAAVVRAPLMSIVLVTEMTGSFNHMLLITTAVLIAHFVAESLKVQPVYHTLYRNLIKRIADSNPQQNTIISFYTLPPATHLKQQPIEKIKFPKKLLIISIVREDEEFVPDGNEILLASDQVVVVHNAMDTEVISDFFKKELL